MGSPWLRASPSRSLPPGKVNFSGVRDLSGSVLAPGETVCTKERSRPLATALASSVHPQPNLTHLLEGQTERFYMRTPAPLVERESHVAVSTPKRCNKARVRLAMRAADNAAKGGLRVRRTTPPGGQCLAVRATYVFSKVHGHKVGLVDSWRTSSQPSRCHLLR